MAQPIERVVIVGAGAMGAAYSAMFSDAPGFEVAFAASGARYDRLRGRTMRVNDRPYTIPVHRPGCGPAADLVLVALKHQHLEGALEDIAALAGPKSVILSVMNGLESEERIGTACDRGRVLHSIAVGIDAVHEQGAFTYANPGRIEFGWAGPGRGSIDLKRVQEALERAGIVAVVAPDILRTLWWKFMINVGVNQASAILRAPYGVFQHSAEARGLMRSLMEEVVGLASRRGIDLGEPDLDAWDQVLRQLSPQGKTSMLQDVEAGRKTEVEVFAGKVVALGEEAGIATPVNLAALRIIRTLEAYSSREG